MHYRAFVMLFATLFLCTSVSANPKYFGYYANNTTPSTSYQPENYQHTNITGIYTGPDPYQWDSTILSELALAKGYGNKAMVTVMAYLFDSASVPYKADPFAAAQFNALVDKLVAAGYLVPGNPEASTVAAFYAVDEPELYGLSDVNGTAHPALRNAIDVIRANPATYNFPIAAISSQDYGYVIQGLRLFDWAGLDHYPGNDGDYRNALTEFTSRLRPEQKLIMVPQAGRGGDLDDTWHNPEYMYHLSQVFDRTVMLMPFLWANPGMTGVRDIPSLRTSYTAIGYQVKYGLYAQHMSSSVPNTMFAGYSYAVSLTFNNYGDKTWRAGTNINLGTQNPLDNTNWGLHRVALPHDVGPYQNVTFNFTVRAPATPGFYNFQWQMVADQMAWFGSVSPATTISVVAPPSGSISASPNPCVIPYGGTTCTSRISWNSNRADAEVWASAPDGSGAQLFSRAQSYTQSATWITTGTTRFTLKAGGLSITHVDVSGIQSTEPPGGWEPPPTCPRCQEP